jgi:2-(1,2-epoxy-1,2-dihydrophenyl)acetyl-CoA isomerase
MEFTAIRTATADGVATITLARPERLNAFTSAMHAELRQALDAAESDEAVRCVVLTGEGRAFSAGQDLTEDRLPGPDGEADFGGRLERDYNPLVERIYAFPKVTIAALNGPTVGASANIALACDICWRRAPPTCRKPSRKSRWCRTRAAAGRCRALSAPSVRSP